jgi:hypothetical protein
MGSSYLAFLTSALSESISVFGRRARGMAADMRVRDIAAHRPALQMLFEAIRLRLPVLSGMTRLREMQ